MKIAVIGDLHLGFSYNTERRDDSFRQAEEAINLALSENVDIIIMTGDIFDSRVPSQEVLGRAMRLFLRPLTKPSNVRLVDLINKSKSELSGTVFNGTPIVAINGNHDRRGRGFTNPVQLLENAGLLIRLHTSTIVFEKNNEKVAIHGMSYVPEQYARNVLKTWDPRPVVGAYNILLLHQNIGHYVYSEDDFSILNFEDMPNGFDLIIDGHIHWSDETSIGKTKFILAGSTVSTQLRKIESERPKGIWLIENGNLIFKKLSTARKIYYKDLKFNDLDPLGVHNLIVSELEQIPAETPKPLVRVVLDGTLKKGYETSDLSLSSIETTFSNKFILKIGKGKVISYGFPSKAELFEKFKRQPISIADAGLQILRKHLKDLNYKHINSTEEILNNLINGDIDFVYNYLKNKNG